MARADATLSVLTASGELCATLGPTGFRESERDLSVRAHRTQEFLLAGRRLPGLRRRLVSYGSESRDVLTLGKGAQAAHWEQRIDWPAGRVVSGLRGPGWRAGSGALRRAAGGQRVRRRSG
ncbi:MAG TPA: hypothetical protein VLH79_03545, partial [Chthonomonadales bacterium]|nr:hypothetical protein [Chthonomonadales bacterium]